jgi:hypothetical protein
MSIHQTRPDDSPTPDPSRQPSNTEQPIAPSAQNVERRYLPYPSHVATHPDAAPHIREGNAITYGKLDEVTDAIATAVAQRLPRRPDAYRFFESRATDVIRIANLGHLRVELTQTGRGVFSYISAITGPGFTIRNSRHSGRTYASRFNDLSRVHKISIDSLGFRVRLYSDDSGVSVETFKGLTYSSNPAEIAHPLSPHRKGTLCLTRASLGSLQNSLYNLGNQQAPLLPESLALELGYPLTMKWSDIQKVVVDWLETNILSLIKTSPLPSCQHSVLPKGVPLPARYSEFHTWVSKSCAAEIAEKKSETSCVPVHERFAIEPRFRLVPVGIRGDYPPTANNGFTWCHLGSPSKDKTITGFHIPGHAVKGYPDCCLVKVRPKDGEQMFVVDYALLQRSVDNTPPIITLAQSLVPITEYRGNYELPVVLIGRDLGPDEVEVLNGEPPK